VLEAFCWLSWYVPGEEEFQVLVGSTSVAVVGVGVEVAEEDEDEEEEEDVEDIRKRTILRMDVRRRRLR
jgi:hypothetical protein